MPNIIVKLGYCRECQRNVEHAHHFSAWLVRGLDGLTQQRLTLWTGLGNWHCRVCNRRSLWLNAVRPDALNLPPLDQEAEFQAAGNYVRRDHSLVLRSERSSRFSLKFRQGVVERLLMAQTTLAGIREELGLNEGDVMAWIQEILEQQTIQIENLKRLVDTLVERLPDEPMLTDQRSQQLEPAPDATRSSETKN